MMKTTITVEELLPRVFRSRWDVRHQGALFRAVSQGPESIERFLEPFLEDINVRTNQKNDLTYLAYAIELALFDPRAGDPFRKVILYDQESQRELGRALRFVSRSIRLSEQKTVTLKELGRSIVHHGPRALSQRRGS